MGKRGPRPTPDNILEMRGRPGHNPPRKDLVVPPVAPKMPPNMPRKAQEIWKYLAPKLVKHGLLTELDQFSFAMLCNSAALYFYAADKLQEEGSDFEITIIDESHQGRRTRHPTIFVMAQAFKDYNKAAAEFGLSPTARVGLLGKGIGANGGSDDGDAEDLFAL